MELDSVRGLKAALTEQILSGLAEVVRTPVYQPAWEKPPVWNLNKLLTTYPGAIGIKIGYTDEAKQTIVGAAERDGRRLIVSVLASEDIYVDAGALLDWAFANTATKCAPEPAAVPAADAATRR